ncbi:LLM class flavin-dependent oxidoreductase [Chitinophaga sp. S165]|uniref:LLM class flavin-dependent oxidoreductase n=1 Tax=Chitinophaga sp. S165 TaxID=2135462 RepID=UPI000D715C07|nr:LLM class flavin-dependent oxidoreductase [Chitinophaga sp. S165]PWV51556.1 FMN-dependent oxidoreductase (nitrilotriacetate monooxygenase family) [Chitinophaga sp. S165]
MANKHLILTAFFFNPQGDNRMSWRYPTAPGPEIFELDYYQRLAIAAEEACIDAIFLADHVGIWDSFQSNIPHYANARLEPITLLSALSAVTKKIGLISTVSASYSEPYNLARKFASLDHLSKGRAGWNVVTSGMNEEAMNYGRDASIEHRTRYQRAAEYLDVVKALWDSWEDDAVLMNKTTGLFADSHKVHHVNHTGDFFKVRGPLNVPRPLQGHPLIVQAGGSNDGKDLAARHADMNFALLRSIEEGKAYREDFDVRLAKYGRPSSALKVLPGILPIVASSREEAAQKEALLESLVPEQVGIDLVSSWVGIDLSGFPLDGPIPDLPDETNFNGQRTNLAKVKQYKQEGLSLREVARIVANAGSAPTIKGTPNEIADQFEEWFTAGAADGFNLMFPTIPEDWMRFMKEVVPELRKRGLVPSTYGQGTLRERLNLPRPSNQFAVQHALINNG